MQGEAMGVQQELCQLSKHRGKAVVSVLLIIYGFWGPAGGETSASSP